MGNTPDSYGKPVFDDSYDFPEDSNDLADWVDEFANVRRGTAAARGLLTAGQLRAGLLFTETDTGFVYWHSGSQWLIVSGPVPSLVVRGITQQSIPDSTFTTLTTFDTPSTLRGMAFNAATGIVTIQRAGVYEIDGFVSINGGGAAGNRVARIMRNGTADANTVRYALVPATNGSVTLNPRRTMPLANGDTIRMQALQTSGGALNTIVLNNLNGYETQLSVRFISET